MQCSSLIKEEPSPRHTEQVGQLELLVKSKICVKNRLYVGGGFTNGFLMNQYMGFQGKP